MKESAGNQQSRGQALPVEACSISTSNTKLTTENWKFCFWSELFILSVLYKPPSVTESFQCKHLCEQLTFWLAPLSKLLQKWPILGGFWPSKAVLVHSFTRQHEEKPLWESAPLKPVTKPCRPQQGQGFPLLWCPPASLMETNCAVFTVIWASQN